jgi:hypothetical protein
VDLVHGEARIVAARKRQGTPLYRFALVLSRSILQAFCLLCLCDLALKAQTSICTADLKMNYALINCRFVMRGKYRGNK